MIGTNLDGSVHILIPAIVSLCDNSSPLPVRRQAISTLSRLCVRVYIADYSSRVIHPLLRVLDGNSDTILRDAALQTLNTIAHQMGFEYVSLFHPTVQKVLDRNGLSDPNLYAFVARYSQDPTTPLLNTSATRIAESPAMGGMGGVDKTDQAVGGDGVDQSSADKGGEAVGLVGDVSLFLGDAAVSDDVGMEPLALNKLKVNEKKLLRAWESIQVRDDWRREDWTEWLRKFSVELLKESPSPALRSCLQLAHVYHPLARNLFNAAFLSCWSELNDEMQLQLVSSLEAALTSENIPSDILLNLLNLAEYMEQREKPLPIDSRTLGRLAEKCLAYAKALHYKETEYRKSQNFGEVVGSLISLNNKLQHFQSALGVLVFAQQQNVPLKETWYEKLGRWEDALQVCDMGL